MKLRERVERLEYQVYHIQHPSQFLLYDEYMGVYWHYYHMSDEGEKRVVKLLVLEAKDHYPKKGRYHREYHCLVTEVETGNKYMQWYDKEQLESMVAIYKEETENESQG